MLKGQMQEWVFSSIVLFSKADFVS